MTGNRSARGHRFMCRAALAEADAHLRHLADGQLITAANEGPGQPEIYELKD